MNAADKAYEEARRRIVRAKEEGATALRLRGSKYGGEEVFNALEALPEEIATLTALKQLSLIGTQIRDATPLAALTALKVLYLRGTQIRDATPLAALTALERLYLEGTQIRDATPLAALTALEVLNLRGTQIRDAAPLAALTALARLDLSGTQISDLRPLTGLKRLVEAPFLAGLTFKGCKACEIDKRIDEISKIGDKKTRARELFAYLEGWEPEEDALFPVALADDKLEIAASHPTEAERDEALKRILHARLRERAEELARLAGNQHPRLAARARGLHEKLDRDFEDLDMVLVHLDVEDLRAIYERRGTRQGEDVLEPDVVDALSDVVRDGPGLTLDNPDVELLEERKRRYAANPPGPEERAAQDRLSRAVADDPETFGPRLRALEEKTLEREDENASGAAQQAVHRNLLIRIGRLALTGFKFGGGVMLSAFIGAHWAQIEAVAISYGPSFTQWFTSAMAYAQETAGVLANIDFGAVGNRLTGKRRDDR